MRNTVTRRAILPFVLLCFACDSSVPTAPSGGDADEFELWDGEPAFHESGVYADAGPVRVMTWNIYVGTNVDVILGAQAPEQIPILAAQAFQVLLSTNFPDRAAAIADQIARARPHLVGLQEISLLRIQSPGDAVLGGTTPAENVFMDYLEILMGAIEARGLRYRVAGIVENTDAEVPMLASLDPLSFDDIRLTDYDVVLARYDVEISDAEAVNFGTSLVIPGLGLEVKRGYVAGTATVGVRTYRFVNTHLEPASSGEAIQLAQAQELVGALNGWDHPVILMGDLNTRAPGANTYNFFLDAGFQDVWTVKHNTDRNNPAGFTSNHDDDLRNAVVDLHERVDYVMVRGGSGEVGARAVVIGDELEDRTASGLWPSDHAGVAARILIVPREPIERIQELAGAVAALGDPAASKLGPILDRAEAQVRIGHFPQAVERLRSFKRTVQLLVRQAAVTDAQGRALIDTAQGIIQELNRL